MQETTSVTNEHSYCGLSKSSKTCCPAHKHPGFQVFIFQNVAWEGLFKYKFILALPVVCSVLLLLIVHRVSKLKAFTVAS